VDFPEPVGPDTIISPDFLSANNLIDSGNPNLSSEGILSGSNLIAIALPLIVS